jgi:hypothetical protein
MYQRNNQARDDQQQQSQPANDATWFYACFDGHASTYRFWNLVKELGGCTRTLYIIMLASSPTFSFRRSNDETDDSPRSTASPFHLQDYNHPPIPQTHLWSFFIVWSSFGRDDERKRILAFSCQASPHFRPARHDEMIRRRDDSTTLIINPSRWGVRLRSRGRVDVIVSAVCGCGEIPGSGTFVPGMYTNAHSHCVESQAAEDIVGADF